MADVDSFSAHVYDMYKCGRKFVPEAALEYHAANVALDRTRDNMTSLFRAPSCFTDDRGYGPIYPVLGDLRDALQMVLARTQDNLDRIAQALEETAMGYANTDDAARDSFLGLVQRDHYPEINVPPPAYPPGKS